MGGMFLFHVTAQASALSHDLRLSVQNAMNKDFSEALNRLNSMPSQSQDSTPLSTARGRTYLAGLGYRFQGQAQDVVDSPAQLSTRRLSRQSSATRYCARISSACS